MPGLYRLLADAVVVLHLLFIVFVVLGGLLVFRHRRWAWVHLPLAAWGFAVEAAGWVCPLTPLETALRRRAGLATWEGDFVGHYLLPLIYPGELTRGVQVLLASGVVAVNAAVYGAWLWRRRRGAPSA